MSASDSVAQARAKVALSRRRLRMRALNPYAFAARAHDAKHDKGTGQTRRKLKADVIARLLRQGKLERRHQLAAGGIETVATALRRTRYSRANFAERVDQSAPARDVLDRLTAREERLLRRRYAPWTKAMLVRPLEVSLPDGRGGLRDWLLVARTIDAVLAVVLDNQGLSEVERRFGLPRRAAAHVLRQGLQRYCDIAGF